MIFKRFSLEKIKLTFSEGESRTLNTFTLNWNDNNNFSCSFGSSQANFGSLAKERPHSPVNHSNGSRFKPEVQQKAHSKVGSLRLAEHQTEFQTSALKRNAQKQSSRGAL